LGESLLWADFWKLVKTPTFSGYFLPWLKLCIHFDKNGWSKFWPIFPQAHLVTLLKRFVCDIHVLLQKQVAVEIIHDTTGLSNN
jgi:hypothetical protein